MEQKIKEIDASVRIENRGLTPVEKIPPDDKVVRFKYGWFPKISLLEDFSDIYDQYLDAIGEKERRGKGDGALRIDLTEKKKAKGRI